MKTSRHLEARGWSLAASHRISQDQPNNHRVAAETLGDLEWQTSGSGKPYWIRIAPRPSGDVRLVARGGATTVASRRSSAWPGAQGVANGRICKEQALQGCGRAVLSLVERASVGRFLAPDSPRARRRA